MNKYVKGNPDMVTAQLTLSKTFSICASSLFVPVSSENYYKKKKLGNDISASFFFATILLTHYQRKRSYYL